MPDAIDKAIAVAAMQPEERRTGGFVRLSNGRQIRFDMPLDLTDAEYVELLGLLALNIRPQMVAAAASPRSRILVPS